MRNKKTKGCFACRSEQELSGVLDAKCLRCAYDVLAGAFMDVSWMARRYASGRCSYAPSMYNDAIRAVSKLGLELQPDGIELEGTIWAKDGDLGWPPEATKNGK